MAQQAISLVPADAPRWEVAAGAGWFGQRGNAVDRRVSRRHLAQRRAVAGSIGYRWAPHLKLTGEIATSSNGRFYTLRAVDGARPATRSFIARARIRTTTASAAVAYQFFDNRWVHRSCAAGVEIAHERDRIESILQPILGPDGRADVPIPSIETKNDARGASDGRRRLQVLRRGTRVHRH
jgi:hypothetical protein